MFCFHNPSPENSCFVVNLVCVCFALPIHVSCCVPECHQKEVKSFTGEKVFFFISVVTSEAKQMKERSSRSLKELFELQFVCSGWKILENA